MKVKTEITLSAKEVAAVEFYLSFHRPQKVGSEVKESLNAKERELYWFGARIDQNVKNHCGGTGLPAFWREENKNGGVYTYRHPLRRNY